MKLENSTILLTGGSLGLGKAAARMLIDAGAKVAITGRNGARLTAIANELGAFPIVADVANEKDVLKTYAEFLDKFGRLDCLINNAGTGTFDKLVDFKAEDFRRVWEINVLGTALMAREAAKLFIKQNYGTIVNIGSTASLKGFENGTVYGATKFAVRSMSETWRAELRKYNVRVIQINPSEVPTAFGTVDGVEKPLNPKKLTPVEIAHAITSALSMDDRGFIQELTVIATNPF